MSSKCPCAFLMISFDFFTRSIQFHIPHHIPSTLFLVLRTGIVFGGGCDLIDDYSLVDGSLNSIESLPDEFKARQTLSFVFALPWTHKWSVDQCLVPRIGCSQMDSASMLFLAGEVALCSRAATMCGHQIYSSSV